MRHQNTITLVVIGVRLFLVWWFGGRRPFIELEAPWDPVLICVEPMWYGWERRGLRFLPQVPTGYRHLGPDVHGWWHVMRKIAPIPQGIIPPDVPLEQSLKNLDPFFKWEPLPW